MATQTGDQLSPLDMQNSGARVPAIRLVKSNPKAAALMSKLVTDQRVQRVTDTMNAQGAGINLANLRGVANEGMQNVNDAETIRQLLSDTDLAAAILVSVILSPKDMVGVEVSYKAELNHWRLPHEVNSTMTNAVRKYFDEVYKIKPRLPTMLEDILFKRGCYPVVVLPENAVDDLIHGNGSVSLESVQAILKKDGQMQSLGILGPTDAEKEASNRTQGFQSGIGMALEHLLTYNENKNWSNDVMFQFPQSNDPGARTLNPNVSVTDNIGILKMPAVKDKIREQKIHQLVGRTSALSAESIARRVGNPTDMVASLHSNALIGRTFHKPNTSQVVVKEVKGQDRLKRRSVGMPLEIHFPSEAVIPVHVPNQPQKQIGFFILLDAEGNPINRGMGVNHYRQLGASLQNNSFSSSMIQRAGLAMSDNSAFYGSNNAYATAAQLYGNMLERNLAQRLRNGLVGNNISIAGHEEVYNLMLARSMANQHTQILYIPIEYMTYMAFEYNQNGTGRSLLENTKIIDSMQANMLVGTVMGALRNAVGRTHVDIQLDENTPDPWKAIEQTIGEMQKVNSNGFPLGTIDPLDIKDGLMRSQFEFSFSGHPKLPDMKVDYSEKNSSYQPPDGKLMEDLRKRRLMSFWLTPEMVDAAVGADFAASVANNSTLLSKRAMMIQQEFTPQVSAHLRKHAINSADLIDELIEIIQGSFAEIMKEFEGDERIEMFGGTMVTREELENNAMVKGQFIRELIEDFIGGFSMSLPEPDTTKVKNLGELYQQQSQLVEEGLKAWISDDMMDDSIVGPEMASHVRIAAAQFKAYMLRDWQIKNGMLPELATLTALGEDGELEVDVAEVMGTHNESILSVLTTLFTANKKAKEKSAKAMEKAGIGGGSDSYGSGGDSGGGFGDTGGGDMGGGDAGGDMGGGDGDFGMGGGMDFDMGGGDTGGDTGGADAGGGGDALGSLDMPSMNFDEGGGDTGGDGGDTSTDTDNGGDAGGGDEGSDAGAGSDTDSDDDAEAQAKADEEAEKAEKEAKEKQEADEKAEEERKAAEEEQKAKYASKPEES